MRLKLKTPAHKLVLLALAIRGPELSEFFGSIAESKQRAAGAEKQARGNTRAQTLTQLHKTARGQEQVVRRFLGAGRTRLSKTPTSAKGSDLK